jgi:HSP20 family protein
MAFQVTRSDVSDKTPRIYPTSPFRLFEDFFNDWAFRSLEGKRGESWTPEVDVREKNGNLELLVSLPGVTEKDIELKVEGQVLTIRGERKSQDLSGHTYYQQESYYGTFSRSFTLPDSADLENIKADYKNGILAITAPQKPGIKPRTIKVNL